MPETKRKCGKVCVHFYLEEGFLVRGTLDPMEALKRAVATDSEYRIGDYWAERAERVDDDNLVGDEAKYVKLFGDHLHRLLQRAKPGLYRIVPVGPNNPLADDGYAWVSKRVNQRGPGAFEGVEFR